MSGCDLTIRQLNRDSDAFRPALRLALDLSPPVPTGNVESPVDNLISAERRGSVGLDLLFGAYNNGQLAGAAIAISSPGGTAMVFFGSDTVLDSGREASSLLLSAVQDAAWDSTISLLEALLDPEMTDKSKSLDQAGFRLLTRLVYVRRLAQPPPPGRVADDLSWLTYRPDREGLFCDAVERTYSQSLDCPELTGLRTMTAVLEAHRAAGHFDPALWLVALRGDEPVGVMLLSRVSGEPMLEVVYMGVAPSVRGTGAGDAVMRRAVDLSVSIGAKSLALAVDERNAPARRLYARWGFEETGLREAWIAHRGLVGSSSA